ncbi:MAG: MBL fold metallo-hydrolase [Rhodospirillales bacterium]|nr:MBL fold metallo-hydrolase [Rhodospirillales bacterium]
MTRPRPMGRSPARLIPISGVTGKGPACFLLEGEGRRILLDIGVGPDRGAAPDLSAVGRVDAVLLSHAHADHAGGLHLLGAVGDPPVHATAITAAQLPREWAGRVNPLPLSGEIDLFGIKVTTGRTGHAPGGVWLHLAVGDGLFYAGDMGFESELYAIDEPPPAATAVIDASAGLDDTPQADRRSAMHHLVRQGDALLPVPAAGRGPEIALFVVEEICRKPSLCPELREMVANLCGPWRETLRAGTADRLSFLLAMAGSVEHRSPGPRGVVIASNVMADAGASARLLPEWLDRRDAAIILSGCVPDDTPVERVRGMGRAAVAGWNVHPRISDNARLLGALGARTAIPAFNGRVPPADWEPALAPTVAATGEVTV